MYQGGVTVRKQGHTFAACAWPRLRPGRQGKGIFWMQRSIDSFSWIRDFVCLSIKRIPPSRPQRPDTGCRKVPWTGDANQYAWQTFSSPCSPLVSAIVSV